jgi:23S rRNA (uracil1939-C5)-methyltransferase
MQDSYQLDIDAVAYGGSGIARRDGKVFFVPGTVVGDSVEAQIVKSKERYNTTELLKVLRPSPLRQKSPCAFSNDCGGCPWIEIDYATQLEWKRSFIVSALKRIGKLKDDLSIPMYASKELLSYRNRIHLKGQFDESGQLSLGYYKSGSNELVTIDSCQIGAKSLNDAVRLLLPLKVPALTLTSFKFELQEMQNEADPSQVSVTAALHLGLDFDTAKEKLLSEALRSAANLAWCGNVVDAGSAPAFLYDMRGEFKFYTRPGQFQQVNLAHNRLLQDFIRDHARSVGAKRVLDVCCGSGNLSLMLASESCQVEGVEASPRAIDMAAHNVKENNIAPGTASFYADDSVKHLWKRARSDVRYDFIILDPPREGIRPGIAPLRMLAPDHIIYVSCNPTTLARDLGFLCRKDYEITQVIGLDFFPNTFHVETVAVLRKVSMNPH